MVLVVFLVLFLSFSSYSSGQYCLCKLGAQTADPYKKVIDYACGNGANCGPIQQNGPCYQANNLQAICSYAANSYFQNKKSLGATCDFTGVASPSTTLPTDLPSGCTYPTTPGPAGPLSPATTTIPTNNNGANTFPGSPPNGMFPPIGLGPAGSNTDLSANRAASLLQFSNDIIMSISVSLLSGFLTLWA